MPSCLSERCRHDKRLTPRPTSRIPIVRTDTSDNDYRGRVRIGEHEQYPFGPSARSEVGTYRPPGDSIEGSSDRNHLMWRISRSVTTRL